MVELVALDNAEIKYSTVQNWYPGDAEGKGGIYNFVTKRGDCRGKGSKISWTQVETGSAITWKYPSCILRGDNAQRGGEFAFHRDHQQLSAGRYRHQDDPFGQEHAFAHHLQGHRGGTGTEHLSRPRQYPSQAAENARAITRNAIPSSLIGGNCGAHTVPYIEARNPSAKIEHEATTSKISDDQLFYCLQRGIPQEEAVARIVNGFCRDVLQQLPMEFAVEAQKLVGISLEGSVG